MPEPYDHTQNPYPRQRSMCRSCDRPIHFVGPYWVHDCETETMRLKHPAFPKEKAPKPDPAQDAPASHETIRDANPYYKALKALVYAIKDRPEQWHSEGEIMEYERGIELAVEAAEGVL